MTKHFITAFGIIVGLIILGLYSFRIYTKSFSPEGTAKYSGKDGFEINVEYSRPYKKGRKLFGRGENSLIQYGEVWRTGANEATEFSINKNIEINGQFLKSGRYTLFSKPNEVSWTIIFNKELDQWGAFNYDESKDAIRVKVPTISIDNETEMFTINFREGNEQIEMRLLWGNKLITIPIKVVT